jgi:hypothetical protein
VEKYVAALEDGSLPEAEFRWQGANRIHIRTEASPGQAISVQVTHHPGWHAKANGTSRQIEADGLGLMWLEPRCSGPCDVQLEYDGGAELRIDPANSNHMIIGVDGGIYATRDRGVNWEHLNDIAIAQAYQVGYDMARPYHVCSGFQDNGSAWGPSATRNVNGMLNSDWVEVLVGDGFHCQPDQSDSGLVYIESQDGGLLRLNFATHERVGIVPHPKSGAEPYRFEWDAPIEISSHDPKTIYFAAQFLFKSTDRGDSWTTISPDLTTGVDRNQASILGKLPKDGILSKNYGVSWYPCITRIGESPVDANVLWVGTQDGNLSVTRDGGKTWRNVAGRVPGVPQGTYVNGIEPSRLGAGAAYVVFDGHRGDDYAIYTFFTGDYGDTWQSVAGDLPPRTGTARVVREDPRNPNLLFLGTEFGAWVSFDKGKEWAPLGSNFPAVRVDDIKIHPREHDLILATHGRALWILDDIGSLETIGTAVPSELTLFDIRPAISWRQFETSSGVEAQKPLAAPNPSYGATITYSLPQATKERPAITVLDAQGSVYDLYKTGIEAERRLGALKTSLTAATGAWKAENAAPVPEAARNQAEELARETVAAPACYHNR